MFGLARERSRPPVACRQRSPRLPTSETTMMSVSHASTRAALALVLASVSWSAGAAAQGPRSALDPITSAVINHPITTSSAEARAHFLEGLREFDLGRLIDANVHFKAAVAADPDFGFAYLNVANTANSLDEFKTNLALAEQNAAGASEAERLQIQMTRKGFDNDLAGQLALGQQLVAKYPQSPRAWLARAGAQGALNENVDARESMAKALELSPKLYVAHVIMGNNYIFGEPRDFTKALRHMQEAEALAPDESNAHMFVGDAYRAQKNLAKAREEYLRGHALEPRNAVLLVKAGHANTFLGDYAAARAPGRLQGRSDAGGPHQPAARARREPAEARADAPAEGIHRALSGQVSGGSRTSAAGQPVRSLRQVSARGGDGGRGRCHAGQEVVPGSSGLQLQRDRLRPGAKAGATEGWQVGTLGAAAALGVRRRVPRPSPRRTRRRTFRSAC